MDDKEVDDGWQAYVVGFTESINEIGLLVVYKGGVWFSNGFDTNLSFLLSRPLSPHSSLAGFLLILKESAGYVVCNPKFVWVSIKDTMTL